jgi:pimeloyl-ACP methyl ester carboxylesterase
MVLERSQITRSVTRVTGFRDPEFDYHLLRAIGVADYGGSTVGECLSAAAATVDGDPESWVEAFGGLGARVEAAAEACATGGHLVSARDHFFRASTYYRTAQYYAESDLDRLAELGRRGRRCFERAGALADPPVQRLAVPFEGAALPGYVVGPSPSPSEGVAPVGTLVVVGGFDSSAEELYFQLGVPGASRGWEVVTFDGPGQNGAMAEDPQFTYRPDYEVPLGAVLDALADRSGSLPGPVAVAGLGFGAYFAARAATRDARIAALVLDSPVVDLYRYLEAMVGPDAFRFPQDIRPEDVVGIPEDLLPHQMLWGIFAVCRRFGVASMHAWKQRLDAYRLGDAVGAIACPVLGLVGDREGPEVLAQADAMASGVSGAATVHRFGVEDGADAHCQANNLRLFAQVVFDWLDDQFAG